ncbi:MAG: hypothetical protein ACK47B_01435 [Armatimonadota bacterium]
MSVPASRETLLDTAWDVARRFVDFGSYGSEQKACRALRRRVPGFAPEEYREAFHLALRVLDAAGEVVKRQLASGAGLPNLDDFVTEALVDELAERVPGFYLEGYRGVLWWVYYWRHLR